MESLHHIVIVGNGVYPTFDDSGNENGKVECWAFDRCWCVVEIVIRDRISVEKFKLNKSEFIIMDNVIEKIESGGQSAKTITEAIKHGFRDTNFFDNLKGRPSDVKEIKKLLLSKGFFASPAEFNEHFRKRMAKLCTQNIPRVSSCIQPARNLSHFSHARSSICLTGHVCSFFSSQRIRWTRSCSVCRVSQT